MVDDSQIRRIVEVAICTYIPGHHLRTVVGCFEHRDVDDFNTIYDWYRAIVLPDFGVGSEIKYFGDPQFFHLGFTWNKLKEQLELIAEKLTLLRYAG